MLTFFRRVELALLAAVPAFLMLALAVVTLASKDIGGLGSVMPLLPLLPAYYWGVLHPRAVPYWFLFLLGLVTDAVTGQPLGLSSLLYMLFLALLSWQRRHFHKEGFTVKWAYFAGLFLAVLAAQWVSLSWMQAKLFPVAAALVQWALTAGCYPLAHAGFDAVERMIHNRRWQILHGR